MQKNKILIVSRLFWPERSPANDICKNFVSSGFKVDVLCGAPASKKSRKAALKSSVKDEVTSLKYQRHGGARIFRARSSEIGEGSPLQYFEGCITFLFFSLFKVHSLKKSRYDKIFIYQDSPLTAAVSGLLIGKPSGSRQKKHSGRLSGCVRIIYAADPWPVSLYEEIDVQNSFLKRFLKRFSAWCYAQADLIITASEGNRDYLVREFNISEDKIVCTGETPESEFKKGIRDDNLLERFAGGFNAVFIGNADKYFEYRTLLEAARLLDQRNIRDVRFVIVGEGRVLKDLQTEVGKLSLDSYFYFEGEKNEAEISKYVYMADALIACISNSSRADRGKPSQIVNCLSSGKPLAAAASGESLRDLKRLGCALISEPEDAETFASNIIKLKEMSREEREQMAKAAGNFLKAHSVDFISQMK